ncbi:MAG: FAD-binding and (Fe-S)-binding domain-containing protein [Granulosicoccus sp.]
MNRAISTTAARQNYSATLDIVSAALQQNLEGHHDFSDAGVALYTSDASNYRQIPLGVVYPRTIDDIVFTARQCREHKLPLLMRGGGTSQNGQCVNEAVVLDCSRYMNKVIDINTQERTALIQPGIVCDSLKAAAEVHNLTFGPDPATHSRCTLGGMIGNNSCGPRSMLAGKTVENVLELEILTSDGSRFWVGPTSDEQLEDITAGNDRRAQIYTRLVALRDQYADEIRTRYPNIKRRVSGYNLDQLLPENGFNVARALVGSEGTCISILQARVRLIKKPAYTRLVVLGFNDIFAAGDSVGDIMPFTPIAMEGLDWGIVGGLNDRNLRQSEVAQLPEGRAWILVELADNSREELDEKTANFVDTMGKLERIVSVKAVDPANEPAIWSIREQGASATSMSLNPDDPDPIVGWEDTAVDPLQLGDYLREFQALIDRFDYTTSLYGHFGDGCIHARITFDTRSEEGVAKWREFSREIATLVVRFGGSLSGEHGDGQAKAEFLPIMYGDELMEAFRQFKQIWDPESRMNPGKLIDAYRMDDNLRFGPEYQTPAIETRLQFTEDPQGFGRSTERCIGMGKCRAHKGAMCPSYQATGEERYSTRGRAHLLHELARGHVLSQGWQDKAVADSMEHCLSCKACKSECPTQVDIASYKAEFMYKHYQNQRRPWVHHLFGQLGRWLPYLSRAPRLINTLQGSLPGKLMKHTLGISADKALPALSVQTFSQWAHTHAQDSDEHFHWFGGLDKPCVILWNDSINNHYRPSIVRSAVNVLVKAGHRVGVAKMHFCCGRPLYEYGLLEQARVSLLTIFNGFQPHLPHTAPVVVLEPSCLSVFKDELLRLFPQDARAQALSNQCLTVSGFLDNSNTPVKQRLSAGIVHLHCHDKSLGLADNDRRWMNACFDTLTEVESGCCGMAGTYGMRKQTRWIGQKLFDRALKPAIETATSHTVIVANGFSCHEQISDNTGRRVLHPVEVLEACL